MSGDGSDHQGEVCVHDGRMERDVDVDPLGPDDT